MEAGEKQENNNLKMAFNSSTNHSIHLNLIFSISSSHKKPIQTQTTEPDKFEHEAWIIELHVRK